MEIKLEVLLVLFGFLEVGFSLRCWECNSAIDVTCNDYFNTTRLKENRQFHQNYLNSQYSHIQPVITEPHLATCENKQPVPQDHKYICLKNIIKDHRSAYHVRRECRMVPMNFKEGNCPDEIKRQGETYYCTTCQQDGCNSGEKLIMFQTVAAILFAIVMFA